LTLKMEAQGYPEMSSNFTSRHDITSYNTWHLFILFCNFRVFGWPKEVRRFLSFRSALKF